MPTFYVPDEVSLNGERSEAGATSGSGSSFRIRRECHAFESQGGCGAGGVHEEVERVESATEEGNAEVLKELDGGAEEEDCSRAYRRKAKSRRAVQADPKKQDE